MILKNMFLLLQLEGYQTFIFLKKFYTNINLWIKKIERSTLDITSKIQILFFIYLVLNIVLIFFYFKSTYFLLYGILLILIQPLILAIANILLYPFDFIIKKSIILKAKNKLKFFPNLIIIGITGSYGKTSQKEILTQILSSNFKVLCTLGNENTPIGISRLILNKLNESYQVLIVEMGAYKKGDIAELCDIVNPEIGILTGITKQHLQRFKNIDNIVSAKLELFLNLKKGGIGYYDLNSLETKNGLQKYKDLFGSIKLNGIDGNIIFDYKPNFEGIIFNHDGQKISTKLLAPHNILQIITAYEIATKLGISKQKIIKAVYDLSYIKHRLELIVNLNNGVYILDDSYNGNVKGVQSIIYMFQKINYNGRKIYLTPGLVELGKESEKIHFELGVKLGKNFDKYLLIQNLATKALYDGLLSVGVDKDSIIFYENTIKAHEDLKNILQKGDIIVFQNDWTENYFLN